MSRLSSSLTFIGDILRSVIPPAVVFFLFVLRIAFLPKSEELDMVAHFAGGFSIAWMAMILWQRWTMHGWIPRTVPLWIRNYAVWGSVALVGIFWEFLEFGLDLFLGWTAQPSVADTMNDFFMDLSGGVLFLILFSLFSIKKPR
jgi:hypothetical protein